ncbi:MAG TPA: rhomboid family intramembrane serine protease [Polyangiaceae bacterium]|nr:rhomboid family intramembrane serine protease [Polyangiaceae bacterium]
MRPASKICRECGGLNSQDEERCQRCGSPFPGSLTTTLQRVIPGVVGKDLPMTTALVGLCSIVFLLTTLDSKSLGFLEVSSYWPVLRWGALAPSLVPKEPWRLLSATFIHFGALHIVFNMLALIDLGKVLERQLGSPRFGVLFISTALAGFIASHFWYSHVGRNDVTGGASGGIFGLVGALIGLLYARRDPAWKQVALRFGLYAALFFVMLPVNNAAHAGGFALGFPLGYYFQRERRPANHHRLFRGLAALGLVLSLASIGLSSHSKVWRSQRNAELDAQERSGR